MSRASESMKADDNDSEDASVEEEDEDDFQWASNFDSQQKIMPTIANDDDDEDYDDYDEFPRKRKCIGSSEADLCNETEMDHQKIYFHNNMPKVEQK